MIWTIISYLSAVSIGYILALAHKERKKKTAGTIVINRSIEDQSIEGLYLQMNETPEEFIKNANQSVNIDVKIIDTNE